MDVRKSKKAIRSVIELYNKILNDGGTYAFSDQYRHYMIKRRMLLKMFNLPYTEDNIKVVVTFPLSPILVNTDPIYDGLCRYKAETSVNDFYVGIKREDLVTKKVDELWNIEDQATYVYYMLRIRMPDSDTNFKF